MVPSLPVALSGDEWIAFSGVVAGVIGTVGGLIFGYVNGRAERTSTRKLAHSERLHGQRLDAYVELAASLERERIYIERTEPDIVFGEGVAPPKPLDEDDWFRLQGRIAVSGSDAVEKAVANAEAKARSFVGAVFVLRSMSGPGKNAPQQIEARKRVMEAREAAKAAIDNAEREMRDELAAL